MFNKNEFKNSIYVFLGGVFPALAIYAIFSQQSSTIDLKALGVFTNLIVVNSFLSAFDAGITRSFSKSLITASFHQALLRSWKLFLIYIATSAIAAIVYLSSDDISIYFNGSILIWALSFLLGHILRGAIEFRKDFRLSAMYQAFNGLSSVLLIFFGYLYEASIFLIILGMASTRSVSGFFLYALIKYRGDDYAEKTSQEVAPKENAYFMISSVVGVIIIFADRWFVQSFTDINFVIQHVLLMEIISRLSVVSGSFATVKFQSYLRETRVAPDLFSSRNYLMAVVLVVLVAYLVGANDLMGMYIVYGVASILILFSSLLLVAQLQAFGGAKFLSYVHIAELIIYVPILYLLSSYNMQSLFITVWFLRLSIEILVFKGYIAKFLH